MPAPTDIQLPSRYRDVQHIAHGGMGEILRATDQELGREVAIKVLAERYAEDSSVRARFRREALAAARLSSNPNIVTIFDVAEHEGRPLIVMEYLPGGSLEQRIDGRRPLPQGEVLDWLEQAALALDAAHEAGIVHRDVKPGNLLLDGRGHLKVADFGIASAAGMDSFTQAGTILGTAGYLSPEQARGEKATAASDRYSLGVVAWELLVGRRPFGAESPTAEAAAHANAPVPSAHRANPSLPGAIDAVFARALAKDPAARYATAAELVAELRHAVHDDAGDTWLEPAVPTTRVVAATPRSSRRWWIPALVALLLAAGVLAAVLASRGGGSDKPVAQPKLHTVVKTVTTPGETIQQTVTAATPPPTTTPTTAPTTTPSTTQPQQTSTASVPSSASGAALNDAGYRKMQARDYAGALPVLEQAVQKLQGTGSTTEAYADYNLAYTRRALGQCTDVLSLLDASESIQGHRKEIDSLRKDATKSCG